jgi:ribosomal protein S27AE
MKCLDCPNEIEVNKRGPKRKRCQDCKAARQSAYYQEWYSTHGRDQRKHGGYSDRVMAYKRANPEKISAHQAVARALKNGVLVRPNTCSRCGFDVLAIAHHPDYSKPLDVIWLCDQCHVRLHKELLKAIPQ